MPTIDDSVRPVFARHETFTPRYGWMRKGVKAAANSPGDAFTSERAPVDLGVGKNMVKSIRFWSRAAKLIVETENPLQPRRPRNVPSANGLTLFHDEDGVDPYLELPGSLWLLHWWMLQPECILPVWWIALNEFGAVEFTVDDLEEFALVRAARSGWRQATPPAVAKDVDCFVRMYTATPAGRGLIDDAVDSPFRELGLLEYLGPKRDRLRFVVGAKPNLPDEILAFACFDFAQQRDSAAGLISVHSLCRDPGSPGKVFKLSEASLLASLERYATSIGSQIVTEAAGAAQLSVGTTPAAAGADALTRYFGVASIPALGPEPANAFTNSDLLGSAAA
jgi:hypothetical protein